MPKGRPTGAKNRVVTPRDVKLMARAEALQRELEDRRPPPGVELSKEILGKFAHNFAALSMKLMPVFKDSGEPIFRFQGHKELWFQMIRFTRDFASDAASYQSATFRAIAIAPIAADKAPGDDAVVIDLKIFENTGTAVALLDEMAEKAKR
jgi:hypothetical protein